MHADDHTLTNGRFTLPPLRLPGGTRKANRLVVADPPEAGWRTETRTNEQATADTELLAAPPVQGD